VPRASVFTTRRRPETENGTQTRDSRTEREGAASLSHASLSLSVAACVCVRLAEQRACHVARTHRARTVRRNGTRCAGERSTKGEPAPARTPDGHLDRQGVCARAFACAGWIASRPRVRVHEVPRGMCGDRHASSCTLRTRFIPSRYRAAISRSFAPTAAVLPACVRARFFSPFYALLLRWEMRAAPRPTPLPRQSIDDRRLAATRILYYERARDSSRRRVRNVRCLCA
jgi:hypothetical protein